jgi:hypothetical protein
MSYFCNVKITLSQEVTGLGAAIRLPLEETDYGDAKRAGRMAQDFVQAILSTRL